MGLPDARLGGRVKLAGATRLSRRGLLVVAAGAGALAVAALGATRYLEPEAAEARVSNTGTPVTPTALDRQILRGGEFKDEIRLLAPAAGQQFARVERTDGTDCFATSVRPDQTRLGHVVCNPKFPAERRVLDFSVFGAERGSEMRVIRVLGIATDTVAEVRLLSPSGTTVRTVPVVDNVYALAEEELEGVTAHAVVAVDEDGEPVERIGP